MPPKPEFFYFHAKIGWIPYFHKVRVTSMKVPNLKAVHKRFDISNKDNWSNDSARFNTHRPPKTFPFPKLVLRSPFAGSAISDSVVPSGPVPGSAISDSAVPSGPVPDSAISDKTVPSRPVPGSAISDRAVSGRATLQSRSIELCCSQGRIHFTRLMAVFECKMK